MAERPGWNRVSPGAMLAGHLPDQFAYRAYAGLSIQATSPDLVRLYEPRLAYPRSLPEPVRSRSPLGLLFE
jgi:hypothetical protein